MKLGFREAASKRYTGEVTVAEIGCPEELVEAVQGLEDGPIAGAGGRA